MQKLYHQHARHIAQTGPIVSFLALWLTVRSGLDGRRAVPLDRSAAAALVGISPRHLRRHWAALIDLFRRGPDGWTRRAEAWPVPAGSAPGRAPWYHPIAPRVLDALISLRTEGRLAYPALRLALWLLPRLRASMSKGKRSHPVAARSTCRALSMSPRTLIRALAALESRGLIAGARGGRVRRVRTFCALTATPDTTVTIADPGAASDSAEPRKETGHNGNGPLSERDIAPKGPHITRGARDVLGHRSVESLGPDELAAWSMVCAVLGGEPASPLPVRLARWAGSPAGLLRWMDQERIGLECAQNPFGWLWAAATQQGSRPGKPSAGEIRSRKRRGLDLPVADRPEPEPEPIEIPADPSEVRRVASERRAIEAEAARLSVARLSAEADSREADRLRYSAEAAERRRLTEIGRGRMAELLGRLKNGESGRNEGQAGGQGRRREGGQGGGQTAPGGPDGGDGVPNPDRRIFRCSFGGPGAASAGRGERSTGQIGG